MEAFSYPLTAITKLECIGDWQALDPTSSVTVFNPWGLVARSNGGGAGSLVYFFARTLGELGVGARAASRLALEGFCEELQTLVLNNQNMLLPEIFQLSLVKAHQLVVQFGKDMGSHGALRVGCIGLIIRDGVAIVGKQGLGTALLHRGDRSFPFVDSVIAYSPDEDSSENALGAANGVKSEIISVAIQSGDLAGVDVDVTPVATIQEIVPAGCRRGGVCVSVGPETIFI